ncbi:slipin family protein [Microcella sp.]|uniref:slipin family protein n=1 Tax=Microcella sp. TaxID=1913979 RepID=UPI002562EB19|nr:slipin family protein [Microcella sp.]MBX9471729.1 slipin family protein [Microcella sp.]
MSFSFIGGNAGVVTHGRWVEVAPWAQAVVIRDGVHTSTEGPGRHRRRRRSRWHVLDLRPQLLTMPTQEVLTADGVQVRLSLVATAQIIDPVAWLFSSVAPFEAIYAALQVALRDRVAALELAAISRSRSTLLDGVDAELEPAVASLGAAVTGITLKDITLPAEVREAIAETALARQRGMAELERARTEAAAFRSLANTAKLLAENPALMELRTLQAATEGANIVIHRDGVARQD